MVMLTCQAFFTFSSKQILDKLLYSNPHTFEVFSNRLNAVSYNRWSSVDHCAHPCLLSLIDVCETGDAHRQQHPSCCCGTRVCSSLWNQMAAEATAKDSGTWRTPLIQTRLCTIIVIAKAHKGKVVGTCSTGHRPRLWGGSPGTSPG